MAAWSSLGLKNIAKGNLIRTALAISKNNAKEKGISYVQVRTSGHHRTMRIAPSSFQWTKFKDLANFYLLLGAIPLGLIVIYATVFIGPAKLALIPEGYDPKPWEYYQHPITRFMAKYVVTSHQENHERNMHHLFIIQEKRMLDQVEYDVKRLMKEREDYKSWYFQKYPTQYPRQTHRITKEAYEGDLGTGGGGVPFA